MEGFIARIQGQLNITVTHIMGNDSPVVTSIAALTALDCPVIRKYTLDTSSAENLSKYFTLVELD